jgi:hypothetical protein
MGLIENYNRLEFKIKKIASAAGQSLDRIKIISVSKTFPVEIVQKAINEGIFLLGENKIQEAQRKIPLLKGDFSVHMIGHLQSNKAKEAVKLFDLIHSIDKVSTASKVNNEAAKIDKIQKILVQVNASGEESKNGLSPGDIFTFFEKISDFKNIKVLGLMNMAPFSSDETIIRGSFRTTKNLLDQVNSQFNLKLTELSMGMSSDYKIAIEEGSTMLRVGTAIFGKRTYL